jgi:two-component system sensor histidine kinase CiaH
MTISILFSGIIYKLLLNEFNRFEQAQRFRIERKIEEDDLFPPNVQYKIVTHPFPINSELIEETRGRIIIMLVSINSGIFIIAGMLGYVLAGRTLKPIKEMMDEQNRFISDASHEIRTPLTSLKSAFEVFLRDKNPDIKEARTIISESLVEVNTLQSLSDSLLQLAQYETPNEHSHFEKTELTQIIQEAISKVKKLAKDKNITIIFEKNKLSIEGNKFGLIDLFVILLDNAIKYSPEKSTITIQSLKLDGHVQVTVTDEGMGIDEKDIHHIFDRFYRADQARSKKKEGGYGLGLSIAKKIVNLHEGSISARNNEVGTTFITELPISHSHAIKDRFKFR